LAERQTELSGPVPDKNGCLDKRRSQGQSLAKRLIPRTPCPNPTLVAREPTRDDAVVLEPFVERGLREIVATRMVLDSLEATLVVRARVSGATWNELGPLLGLTRQGVRARHLGVDPIYASAQRSRVPTIEEYYRRIDAWIEARARSDRERPVGT